MPREHHTTMEAQTPTIPLATVIFRHGGAGAVGAARRLLSSGTALLLAAPAMAQLASGTTQELEPVIVTGSNIKRLDTVNDSPVQVLDRDAITRTGARTVKELIDSLASSSKSLSDVDGAGSFAPGASSASLRHLGKQSTLILLNFRRVAPNALADDSEVFTNLDALPLGAVERIEVLKSGAAAIYGSDAVAGVINIITRTDYQGFELQASHEQSITSGELGSSRASLTVGAGSVASDGYNTLFNVEVYHREPLIWGNVLGEVRSEYAAAGAPYGYGTASSYSYPGNVLQPDGNLGPAAGCSPKNISGGLCRYDRYSRFEAVNRSNRLSLLGAGALTLGEGSSGFAELNYSRIETAYVSPYPVYGPDAGGIGWVDPVTKQSKTFTYFGLPASDPYNLSGQDNANFRYRFIDSPSGQQISSDQYRLLAGLRKRVAGWEAESAVGYMGSRTAYDSRGGFSETGFKKHVGDYSQLNAAGYPADPGFFNHGYKLAQPNDAAVINAIFPAFGFTGRYDQAFADVKASGKLAQLAAGPVDVALGADLRHETFTIAPTDNLASGDIAGYGTTATDAKRTFGAFYGELRIPVLDTLQASLAARYDKYPATRGHFSPKAGLRWKPTDSYLLRGTVETGFRAPNLVESAPSTKVGFANGINDPQRCPQANALSADLTQQADALPDGDPRKGQLYARAEQLQGSACSTSAASIVTDNPKLAPENSRSFTLGIVFEPNRVVSGSIDYWNIQRRNEIGLIDIGKLLTDESNPPPGNSITRLSPTAPDPVFTPAERAAYGVSANSLVSVQQQFVNTRQTKTSGVDLAVNATIRPEGLWGKFAVVADLAYLIDYKAFSAALGGFGNNLAGTYNYPRLKLNITGIWTAGSVETSLRANYSSSTSLQADYDDRTYTTTGCGDNYGFTPNECRVASYTTWDATVRYDGLKNLTLAVGLKNLFATKPPVDRRAFAESGGFLGPIEVGDVSGRMLRVAVEYRFF